MMIWRQKEFLFSWQGRNLSKTHQEDIKCGSSGMTRQQKTNVAPHDEMIKWSIVHVFFFWMMSNTSHGSLKHEPASNITHDINVENHAVWLAELYLQLCACFFFDATLEMPCHNKTSRTLSRIEDTWRMDYITSRRYHLAWQDNKTQTSLHMTRW